VCACAASRESVSATPSASAPRSVIAAPHQLSRAPCALFPTIILKRNLLLRSQRRRLRICSLGGRLVHLCFNLIRCSPCVLYKSAVASFLTASTAAFCILDLISDGSQITASFALYSLFVVGRHWSALTSLAKILCQIGQSY
jgi:hypothetical protein